MITRMTDDPGKAEAIRAKLIEKKISFQESADDILWQFYIFSSDENALNEALGELGLSCDTESANNSSSS